MDHELKGLIITVRHQVQSYGYVTVSNVHSDSVAMFFADDLAEAEKRAKHWMEQRCPNAAA